MPRRDGAAQHAVRDAAGNAQRAASSRRGSSSSGSQRRKTTETTQPSAAWRWPSRAQRGQTARPDSAARQRGKTARQDSAPRQRVKTARPSAARASRARNLVLLRVLSYARLCRVRYCPSPALGMYCPRRCQDCVSAVLVSAGCCFSAAFAACLLRSPAFPQPRFCSPAFSAALPAVEPPTVWSRRS